MELITKKNTLPTPLQRVHLSPTSISEGHNEEKNRRLNKGRNKANLKARSTAGGPD